MPELRPPLRHNEIVVLTIIGWILIHILLVIALGLPNYIRCRQANVPPSAANLFGCGGNIAVVTLVIGLVQLVYGLIVGLLLLQWRRALAQGILIGTALVALTFTIACFGLAATL